MPRVPLWDSLVVELSCVALSRLSRVVCSELVSVFRCMLVLLSTICCMTKRRSLYMRPFMFSLLDLSVCLCVLLYMRRRSSSYSSTYRVMYREYRGEIDLNGGGP